MRIREKIRLNDAIGWTGARLVSGDPGSWIKSISTDSRTVDKGDFFIPLKGENFDGHDFIDAAVRAGAAGLVYEERIIDALPYVLDSIEKAKNRKLTVLEAGNSLEFLMDLARSYLGQFKALTIGITGSLGKTTTKSFITAILSKEFNVVSAPRNYNTEVGVSKTVFEVGRTTDFLIVELGMRGEGQIRPLAETSNVKIGAITSISGSHMEFFNNIESLAAAKAEIAGTIKKAGGRLFLNADDPMTPLIKKIIEAEIIEFGEDRGTEYNFVKIGSDDRGRFVFNLFYKKRKLARIRCSQPGAHNLYNACLAAAVCHYVGEDINTIKYGLENADMEDHRMKILEYGSLMVLDDCYNASPVSVRGALDTLKLISGKKRRRSVAILGDMLELGDSAPGLHHDTGKYAAKKDIDVLVTSGKLAKNMYQGFIEGKKSIKKGHSYEDKDELLTDIGSIVKPGDVILVKGSRANRMEDIVDSLERLGDEEPHWSLGGK